MATSPIGRVLKRHAEQTILEALADTRVVLVNGARQSGKSTLLRRFARNDSAEWRDLDLPLVRQAAVADPVGPVTKLPLPRFASLKTDRVNLREGPSKDHATKWVYERAGLPVEITAGAVVAGYAPIRSEIDPAPLMQKLAAQGARLALPVITARGRALIFRAWNPRDRLLPGPLGILEPSPAAALTPPG